MTQYCFEDILDRRFCLLINSWLKIRWSWFVANNEFWSQVRCFLNDFNEWYSHPWKLSVDHLTSRVTKYRYLLQFVSSLYFLCALTRSNVLQHMEMEKDSHRSFGPPLFFGSFYCGIVRTYIVKSFDRLSSDVYKDYKISCVHGEHVCAVSSTGTPETLKRKCYWAKFSPLNQQWLKWKFSVQLVAKSSVSIKLLRYHLYQNQHFYILSPSKV